MIVAQERYPQLMTVTEASEVLRRPRRTVLAMCERGEIRAFRDHGRWVVHRDALAERYGIDLGGGVDGKQA